MKAVSVQKKKVTNAQIDRKLEEIMLLLKQAIKTNETGSGICEYCGKPVRDHKSKASALKRVEKILEEYRTGRIKGRSYRNFAEFSKGTS